MAKIVVANFYPIHPVGHGGQRRIYYLSRELSRDHDVTMVTLSRGTAVRYFEIGPSLAEIQVPAGKTYIEFESAMHRTVPMTADVAYAMKWSGCHLYQSILQERVRTSHLVVSEHPYSVPALLKALVPSRPVPLIYNSQNVELRQKKPVLAGRDDLLDVVRSVESMAITRSAAIIACSGIDKSHFAADYSAPESKIAVVENGVDTRAVPTIGSERRSEFRKYLQLGDRFTTVFGGSYHFPNLAAVEAILGFARDLPEMIFVILGSICNSPALSGSLPPNVLSLGTVSEQEKWLCFAVSDLALNPMTQGSGSNIKMFEYAAAGLPTLSTGFGARATGLASDKHYIEAELGEFTERLAQLSRTGSERLVEIGNAAREFVAKNADWSIIGEAYRKLVASVLEVPALSSDPKLLLGT